MVTFLQSTSQDVDQVELKALREGESSVTFGTSDESMSGEAIDAGSSEASAFPFPLPDWEKEGTGLTKLVGQSLELIRERQKLLGDLYPFEVRGSGLKYKRSKDGVYEFCLATCDAVSNSTKRYRRLIRHFERVSKSLIMAFLGPDSKGCRFGWPSEDYFERLPNDFTARIEMMKLTCQFDTEDWSLTTSRYMSKTIENANDAKIDFVIRRSLLDHRPGGMTVVGQCGCGKHDVEEGSLKHREIGLPWLQMFFSRVTVPMPIFVFTTSQHVACHNQMFSKQSTGQTMIFDRIRLVKLANRFPECLRNEAKWMEILTTFVKRNDPKS